MFANSNWSLIVRERGQCRTLNTRSKCRRQFITGDSRSEKNVDLSTLLSEISIPIKSQTNENQLQDQVDFLIH